MTMRACEMNVFDFVKFFRIAAVDDNGFALAKHFYVPLERMKVLHNYVSEIEKENEMLRTKVA